MGPETIKGINIIDIGLRTKLLFRRTWQHLILILRIIKLRPKIAHIHDPELMLSSLILKLFSIKIIIDLHEDTPMQIIENKNDLKAINSLKFAIYKLLERICLPHYNHIISATDGILTKLSKYNKYQTSIYNYPPADHFSEPAVENKFFDIVYIGSISYKRGLMQLLEAIQGTNITFALLGDIQCDAFESELKAHPAWNTNVTYFGFITSRSKITSILHRSKIGMCTLHHCKSYINALPVKLFEYMAAGIPVICTNHPTWESIVSNARCGVTVDPMQPNKIRENIIHLLSNPLSMKDMGLNGKLYAELHYNWNQQIPKLLNIYRNL